MTPGGETDDVSAGLLLRQAALSERLSEVDTREAGHFQDIGRQLHDIADGLTALRAHTEGIASTVAGQSVTVAALEGLDERLADLAGQFADAGGSDSDSSRRGYRPGPQPPWWLMASATLPRPEASGVAGGQEPAHVSADAAQEAAGGVQRLSAWVSQVLQPGYGHLAAGLGACWAQHPLCLYTLDWLCELWSVLYLTRRRTPATLAGQAEFQTRLLPTAAAQMEAETAGCTAHPRRGARAGPASLVSHGPRRQAPA